MDSFTKRLILVFIALCMPLLAFAGEIKGLLEPGSEWETPWYIIDSGKPDDLALLGDLDEALRETSICGLGQIALTPVLSILRHFPKSGVR